MPDTPRGRKAAGMSRTAAIIPDPPAELHVTPFTWPAGRPIHRIHLDRYAANAFNPGVHGNARFSPITNAKGRPIRTLYGGIDFECAAMETVFHDVPFAPGFKSYDKRKLSGQTHSVLEPRQDLKLADLRNVALRKLGVPRAGLIDTEKDAYPRTRKWAAAIHARHASLQGLVWVSRQDDRAQAVMLFGDRVKANVLARRDASRGLVADLDAYLELLALADAIGVSIVAART